MTTDKGAPAPSTLEEMAENVAVALLDRDLAPHFEAARSVGWDLLEKAGVPALLAEAAKAEFWKAAAMRCDCVGTFRELEAARDAARARVAELETGLKSIAANTCCDRCQEAAFVARSTLNPRPISDKLGG